MKGNNSKAQKYADTNILNDVAFKNGYIQFSKSYFNGLSSNVCYWTSTQYNENKNYAIMNNNEETIKLCCNNEIYTNGVIANIYVIVASPSNPSVKLIPFQQPIIHNKQYIIANGPI